MGESLLLLTLITLVVLTIRRSKPVVLDRPLVISRPGKYHITFAPQLNPAQSFIEAIATQAGDASSLSDSEIFCYAVHDAKVATDKDKLYLMAVAARGGMLYFQAINPMPVLSDKESHHRTMSEFALAVLAEQPLKDSADEQSGRRLREAVQSAAQERQIKVEELQP
ncbi:MAG: hypothetical protein ABL873_02060 [Gallionella sp.]